MHETHKSNCGISGKYRFKTYKSIDEGLEEIALEQREVQRVSDWHHNLVVYSNNHGLGIIAQHLIGMTTYPLEITQLKIGTGTNAPNAANTDLQTVVTAGIPRALQSITPTSVTIEFYVSSTDLPNGTYNELGIFCGDQLFARSLITPAYTKATNEDTGVEYIITLSNA